jgi:conjugative transfer region protein (TIGR03748 family)
MRDLNYELKLLCRRNRDGSYTTQRDRERNLTLMADQLFALGFRRMTVHSIRAKHVEALTRLWLAQDLNPGTMKNRMTALRWWAEKVNLPQVIAASNDHYGIAERVLVSNVSKARHVDAAQLARVADPYVRMSLELQQAFGLRREEAIKFQPRYADRGHKIVLKESWTKGGKAREIPIRTAAQREVLNRVHHLAGVGSLIPPELRYIEQRRRYERHTVNAGLSKMHGLRHAYAQSRYRELTGWAAPAAGGPSSSSLTTAQRARDRNARLVISQELGHERAQTVAIYLSRGVGRINSGEEKTPSACGVSDSRDRAQGRACWPCSMMSARTMADPRQRPRESVRIACLAAGMLTAFHVTALETFGRYSVERAGPTISQRDLLAVSVSPQFPPSVSTVGQAIDAVLIPTGYRLSLPMTAEPARAALLTLSLPTAHREFRNISVRDVLETLVGPAFKLIEDPVHRLVSFERCGDTTGDQRGTPP